MTDDLARDLEEIAQIVSKYPRGLAELRELIASLPSPSPLALPGVSDTSLPSTEQQTAELASGPVGSGSSTGGTASTGTGTTPGSISGTSIAPGTLTANAFASSIRPIQMVDGPTLPTLPDANFPDDSVVFNLSDRRLYQNEAGVWHTVDVVTGIPNALDPPTIEGIYYETWTDQTVHYLDGDFRAQSVWASGTPPVCDCAQNLNRSNGSNVLQSAQVYLDWQGSATAAYDASTYFFWFSSALEGNTSPLPYVVGSFKFYCQWWEPSSGDLANYEITAEVYCRVHSTVVAYQTVDAKSVDQDEWYQLTAAYERPPGDSGCYYIFRMKIRQKNIATGGGSLGTWTNFGEPQLHFAGTPDAATFSPDISKWVPSELKAFYDGGYPIVWADSSGFHLGPGTSSTSDVKLQRLGTSSMKLGANIVTQLSADTSGDNPTLKFKQGIDSYDTMQILGGSAGILFGTGAAQVDTKVSRWGVGVLEFGEGTNDSVLRIAGKVGGEASVRAHEWGDTSARAKMRGDATLAGLQFGPGNATEDLRAYRSGSKTLTVDDNASGAAVLAVLGQIGYPANTTALTSTEGYSRWESTKKRLELYDAQRARAIGAVGWVPYAYQAGHDPHDTYTSAQTLAANGGSAAIPIYVPGHMLLEQVSLWCTDAATQRTWGWDLYEQYLNNGNAAENTLARVAACSANETFTPSSASKRTLTAGSAPVYLAPGVYWLVVQSRHATSSFGLGGVTAGTLSNNRWQSKTTSNPNGSTLDFVAATWTKQTTGVAVVLEGRVFGQTTAF